jgi:hypothetical protein
LPMRPSRMRETVSVTEPGTWVTGRSASLVRRLRALSPHSLFRLLISNRRATSVKSMIKLAKGPIPGEWQDVLNLTALALDVRALL